MGINGSFAMVASNIPITGLSRSSSESSTTASSDTGGRSIAPMTSLGGGGGGGKNRRLLPPDFIPTPYSVICGRGRRIAEAVGNRRLRVIATMFIDKYAKATRKEEKSAIVSDILEIVRDACPEKRYAFIKCCGGKWYEVENLHAREKIGTVLRDCLHSKYRSSTKSKLERRRQRKECARRNKMIRSLNNLQRFAVSAVVQIQQQQQQQQEQDTQTIGSLQALQNCKSDVLLDFEPLTDESSGDISGEEMDNLFD